METQSNSTSPEYYYARLQELIEQANERNRDPNVPRPSPEDNEETRRLAREIRAQKEYLLHPLFGTQPANDKYMRIRYRVLPPREPIPTGNLNADSAPPHVVDMEKTMPIMQMEILKDWIMSDSANPLEEFRTVADAERSFFQQLISRPTDVQPLSWDGKADWIDPRMLFIHINRASTRIARITRRGKGNVIIISRYVLDQLRRISWMNNSSSWWNENMLSSGSPGSILQPVGIINGYARVFLNPEWPDDHPVVVGYKGTSDVDAGSFLIVFEKFVVLKSPEKDAKRHEVCGWSDYYGTVEIKPYRPSQWDMLQSKWALFKDRIRGQIRDRFRKLIL